MRLGSHFLAGFLALVLGTGSASGQVKDEPVKLDTFVVRADPFRHWGFGGHSWMSFFNKLFGGPRPPDDLVVLWVIQDSPADKAGIQSLDEILEINGEAVTDIPFREIKKIVERSEIGTKLRLMLYDGFRRRSRIVEPTLPADRRWAKAEVCKIRLWDVSVKIEQSVSGRFERKKRIVGWKQIPPKTSHRRSKKKLSDKEAVPRQMPIYEVRRLVTISWGGKKLTVIEREGQVELIESDVVPENDAVVGQLVKAGATIDLRRDGSYEVIEALPNVSGNAVPTTGSAAAESAKADSAPETKETKASGETVLILAHST